MAKDLQELENGNSSKEKYILKKLLSTPEGHILEIGLILTLLSVITLGLGYLRFPEKANVFIGMSDFE